MGTQPNQKTSNQKFDVIATRALEFMLKKFHDYGSAWTWLRPHSHANQIFIKLKRIRTIQDTGSQKVQDKLEDDILGALNYAAMGLSRVRGDVGQDAKLTEEAFRGFMEKSFATARETFQNKNHDYGEAWRDLSVSTMIDLMMVKLERLRKIKRNKGEVIVSEGSDGSYIDIMNYCIFCLILIDEGVDPMD